MTECSFIKAATTTSYWFFLCKCLCLLAGFLQASPLRVFVQAVLEDKQSVIRIDFSGPLRILLSLVFRSMWFCTVLSTEQ